MAARGTRPPGRRQAGFTLVELFATVAVAGVLAAIALPNLQEFIKNNARSTRMNTLVTAFNYARGDAVTRRRTVTVCAASAADINVCGGSSFQNGIRVEAGGALVRIFEMEPDANYTLIGAESDATPLGSVPFDANGRASGLNRSRFIYCDDRGAEAARAIILSATGHPRTSTDGIDADSIHEITPGVNITCP